MQGLAVGEKETTVLVAVADLAERRLRHSHDRDARNMLRQAASLRRARKNNAVVPAKAGTHSLRVRCCVERCSLKAIGSRCP